MVLLNMPEIPCGLWSLKQLQRQILREAMRPIRQAFIHFFFSDSISFPRKECNLSWTGDYPFILVAWDIHFKTWLICA
jgi:hypothetical protein